MLSVEMSKTSKQKGKLLMKGDSGNHSTVHQNPIRACYPISARDQSRLHQFGKKVPLGKFFGYASEEENIRRVGECYQWKANGQCSKGDSCSFRHEPAYGQRCAGGPKEQSCLKAKAQTDGKIPSKSSISAGESPFLDERPNTMQRFSLRKICESVL